MNFSWKRFLSMVLAIVMVVGLVPFGALDVYAAEADGWYWDGTTLYIKDGSITKGKLYSALVEKYGDGSYKYAASKPSWGWGKGGTEVKSSDTDSITVSRGNGAAGKKGRISWTGSTDCSFTVEYYYIPSVTVTGKDGVTASNVTNKVLYGKDVTFTLPAMGEGGWVASYPGGTKELSATEATNVTVKNITSASAAAITVTLVKAESYNVTTKANNDAYGTVSVSATSGIAGTEVTVTATPTVNTDSAHYALDYITVNGEKLEGTTFTIGEADVEVIAYFSKTDIHFGAEKNTSIKWNGWYQDGTKLTSEELEELKKEIFNKLDVESLPAGATWENVTIQYYPWYTTRTQGSDFSNADGLQELNAAREDLSILGVGWTFSEFGQRAYKDGAEITDTQEKVRITYNGMWIDTLITLTEGREPYQISYTDPGVTFVDQDDIDEAVKNALSGNSVTVNYALAEGQELPAAGETKVLTYNVSVESNGEDYVACSGTITITATKMADRNNNGLTDGSEADPFTYYVWKDGETVKKTGDQLAGEAAPAAPSIDTDDNGLLFKDWTESYDEASKTYTYTANWDPDTNNNDIVDTVETITVTWNGNATVTVGGQDVNSGVATVYDSTVGTVAVVVTPASGYYVEASDNLPGTWANKDVDSGWLSTDYRNVYTGTLTVEAGKSYTVEVTSTKFEWALPVETVTVKLSGYLFNGITSVPKEEILKAIFGENVNTDLYDGAVDEGWGSITIKLGEPFQYKVTVKATDKYPAASDTIMVTASDNRTSATIENAYVNGSSFNTEDDFKSHFANNCVKVNDDLVDLEVLLNWNGKIEWTKNDDGTYTAVVTLNESKDWLKSTATFSGLTWTVSEYEVSFQDWNGTELLAAKKYPYGTAGNAIEVPADPTREGYTFTGWTPAVDDVKGSVTYVANYDINTYTITWTVNGETFTTTDVKYGEAVTAPAYTTPEGHTFHGWTVPATMPAENITIDASLTVNKYDVIWVWENAEGQQTTTVTLPYGTAITVPAKIPAQYTVGNVTYTRTGWTGLVDGATVPVDGITYTATYTNATAWIVNFDSNGGSEVNDVTVIVPDGETATVAVPSEPTRPGYRFDGWFLNGELYDFSTAVTADITLTAKWTLWVAELNGVKYDSLTEAINVAVNGDTIKVLADHHIGNTGIAVKGKTLTIDLGGHTVSSNGTTFAVGFNVHNGHLTLINGTVIGNNNAGGSVAVSARGTLVLGEGLTVKAMHEETSTSMVGNSGILIIEDGAYISNVVLKGSCDVTINGGSYVRNVTVTDKSNVTINAGSIIGELIVNGDDCKVTIYGGYFSQDVSEYVAPGYACVADTDNGDGYEETTFKVESHDIVNGNGVKDEDETITIVVNKAFDSDAVTVTGAVLHNGNYVIDSVNNPYITITAAPTVADGISASYVKAINGKGAALLSYNNFATTETIEVKNGDVIEVDFEAVPVVKNPADVVEFNFFTREFPYEDIYNSVINTPAIISENTKVEYTYFARPAMKHTVSIDALDLDSSIKTLLNTIGVKDFSFDMDALWLPLDAEIEESVDLETAVSTYLTKDRINGLMDIYNAAHDAYIAEHGGGILNEILAAAAGGAAALEDIQAIYTAVYASAYYYGAHEFGYSADGADTVDEIIKIEYTDASMYWTAEATVTLKDSREKTFISGSDVTLTYRDYTDEDLLAKFGLVDENGNPVAGEIYSVQMTDPYTFEGKNVSETTYELAVKFAGNENYRPAEKTFNITVAKAGLSIDLPNLNITHGDVYDPYANISMGNAYGIKQEVIDSLVEIFIGLDVADLEVTTEGEISGIGAHIQIMLPKDDTLATIFKTLGLDIYSEQGETLNLTELQNVLDKLDDALGSFDSDNQTVSGINSVLQSITGLVDLSNVEITFGGKYPSNVGVYLYGAVSTSGNYETAYDVAYMIIKPKTAKVDLAWNYVDENYIFSKQLLKYYDLGAHIVDAEQYNNENLEVLTLFLGADENAKFVTSWKGEELGNGAYVEIAFLIEFGNEFYYAEPLVRPVVIVPNLAEVEIAGTNENHVILREFNNEPQNVEVKVTLDGEELNKEFLTVNYVGVKTNTQIYNSTVAPTNAGAYVVTATYLEKTADGDIVAFGVDVATLVIEPTTSTIDVPEKVVIVDGDKSYNLEETLITVGSTVSGLKPDTTIISAQISSDGTYSENGWEAISGNVNVDFPAWVDALIAEHAPSVVDGITMAELKDKLLNKLPELSAKLTELGATNEIVNSFNNLVENVVKAMENIPEDVTLTFADDVSVKNVGAYAVIGVVTDSDHYPSVDAGLLVIVPDVDLVHLKWNYEDDNSIWTRELLNHVDLLATAFDDAEYTIENADATAKITYQFIGIDKNGELVVLKNADELVNGTYIEMAYIELKVDGEMIISDMIARPVAIVPGTAEVTFVDVNDNNARHFFFDNAPKAMDVVVTIHGEQITPAEGTLTVTYIGVQTNGKTYNSTVAPTQAGVYTVVASYVDYAANGSTAHVGAAVGIMAIEPAESAIEVTGGTVIYDGNGHTATVEATGANVNPDYTLISGGAYVSGDINEIGVDAFHGNVNIDFPNWLDKALAEHEFKTEGVDTAYLIDFISSYRDDLVALIHVDELVALGADEAQINAYIAKLDVYIDELLAVLAKLPKDVALTFNDDVTYTEPGAYLYYGIVTDSDHYPSADAGLLIIEKLDITFDLLDTTVTWDGEGHMVNVNNVNGADYVTLIVDRENNAINILIDEDAQYLVNTLARILDVEFDGDVQMSTIIEQFNGKELAAAIVELIAELEKLELSEDVLKALAAVKTELESLPENGTVTINGALPTEIGKYEVYAVSYSQYYKTATSEATLEIVPVQVEVILNDNTKVYGQDDPELTYTVKYFDHEGNELADAGALNVVVTREAGENVGEYAITATAENANYNITITNATLTIEKAWVKVVYNDLTKVYGEADPEITYTTTSNVGENAEYMLVVPTERVAGENVGTYVVGGEAYVFMNDNIEVTTEKAELTITKADLTITLDNKTKVYGENDPELTYTVTGLVNGDTAEDLNIVVTREKGEDAGTYAITATASNDNYNITITNATLTIEKAWVKVVYNDLTKVYGEADPEITYTTTSNVGENAEYMLVVPTERVAGENVGTYVVGDEAYVFMNDNIEVTTEKAELTITKADLTITLDNKTKVYGENDPELTYTVTGLVNGDTAEDLNIVVTREKGEDAGTYAITATASNDNYNITITNATLTIEKAWVKVVYNDLTKVYGEADPEITYTTTSNVGENAEYMLVVPTERVAGENVGTYVVGGDAYVFMNDNFDVEVIPGDLTIKPAEITITVQNNTVLAGTVTPDVVVNVEIVNGNVAEDTLNVQATWNAETVDGKLVHGEYANNAVTYTESNNWVVTVVNGTLTVELGDYVCWNPATAEYWDDLSDALDDVDGYDENGDPTETELVKETIQMLKDYREQYVFIAPGTTLDLADHTVTASFVVGVEGAYLTGDINAGKLVVNARNFTLDEGCYVDAKGYDVLPIYVDGAYTFARFQPTTTGRNRGLVMDGEELYFQFNVNMSGFAGDEFKNGASDNRLSIVVRLEWVNESKTGLAHQDFVFLDEHIVTVYNNTNLDFYLSLSGFDALDVDLDTLIVKAMVIADCGVASSGTECKQ